MTLEEYQEMQAFRDHVAQQESFSASIIPLAFTLVLFIWLFVRWRD